jgi:site-specific recombinase XerC
LDAFDEAGAIGVRDAALRVAGLRRAELAGLLLEDLELGAWTLRVLGKGGRERCAFVAQARPELEAWLRRRARHGAPSCPAPDVIARRNGAPRRARLRARPEASFPLDRLDARGDAAIMVAWKARPSGHRR